MSKVSKVFDPADPIALFIDQDVSTFSTVKPGSDGSVFVHMDLGGLYYVHRITIYYRFYIGWWPDSTQSRWCQDSPSKCNQCITGHNNAMVSVFTNGTSQKLCGTLQISSGLTQKDHIYTFLCHSIGDAVRLHKSSVHIISFADIIVDTKNGKYN